MLGAGGCIPGTPEFLAALRAFASANGTVLIFDEVMTSRLSPGGRQQLLGIAPDLTTLGKYLGGGLSFGAFGGRAEIMAQFDPRRPNALSHSGTFNNNILTMTAAVTGLRRVLTPEASRAFNARGDRLREALADAFRTAHAPYRVTGLGSIVGIHAKGPAETAAKLKNLLFFDLVERGIYLAPRGFIALSLPVGDTEVEAMMAAVRDALGQRESLLQSVRIEPES
jgi:glutamate-1-semialdehyde 2,1-aminomutase